MVVRGEARDERERRNIYVLFSYFKFNGLGWTLAKMRKMKKMNGKEFALGLKI